MGVGRDPGDERADLSEETLRKYYEANPKRFMEDEEATVLEILVATREEAEALYASRAGSLDAVSYSHLTLPTSDLV